jgi:2-phospho-L-lactate guanylyltransferase (CobY/MobA/RfbA family)
MSPRPRDRILANLESIYRQAYERAKTTDDKARMADLDAAYQREQLLLEVLLDIRDAVAAAMPYAAATPEKSAAPDPVTALETIHRLTKLR